jgi:uncharacterized membrane-anchored protein
MAERADGGGRAVGRALAAIIAEIWSFVVFTLFAPRTNTTEHDRPKRDGGVTSLSKGDQNVDDPLETSRPKRDPATQSSKGSETGREDYVSDEFLSQLEQRTQQVKITLANLEAEKIRIEEVIAQLQPIVPHYDALVAAERQIAQSMIALELAHPAAIDTPPAEGSGWSTEAPGGEAAAPEAASKDPGWSGSWNS